jgi:hypothetical protein
MLNALMPMQNKLAGIKPNCKVCNPIAQTIKLLTIETMRPNQSFRPTSTVETMESKQEI